MPSNEKPKKNDLLEPENYYAGYQENVEKLKLDPNLVDLDKLCYLVFKAPDGQKLLEIFKERYLLPGFVRPGSPEFLQTCAYYEGFKEAFRMIIGSVLSYERRIEAESKKKVEEGNGKA